LAAPTDQQTSVPDDCLLGEFSTTGQPPNKPNLFECQEPSHFASLRSHSSMSGLPMARIRHFIWWTAFVQPDKPKTLPVWLKVYEHAHKEWEQKRLRRYSAALVNRANAKRVQGLRPRRQTKIQRQCFPAWIVCRCFHETSNLAQDHSIAHDLAGGQEGSDRLTAMVEFVHAHREVLAGDPSHPHRRVED
jgi:hypothetical protein